MGEVLSSAMVKGAAAVLLSFGGGQFCCVAERGTFSGHHCREKGEGEEGEGDGDGDGDGNDGDGEWRKEMRPLA